MSLALAPHRKLTRVGKQIPAYQDIFVCTVRSAQGPWTTLPKERLWEM